MGGGVWCGCCGVGWYGGVCCGWLGVGVCGGGERGGGGVGGIVGGGGGEETQCEPVRGWEDRRGSYDPHSHTIQPVLGQCSVMYRQQWKTILKMGNLVHSVCNVSRLLWLPFCGLGLP